jgi:putative addiction module killer protein
MPIAFLPGCNLHIDQALRMDIPPSSSLDRKRKLLACHSGAAFDGSRLRFEAGKLRSCFPVARGYCVVVVAVRRAEEFAPWLRGFRDVRAKSFVQARVESLICGNPGDARPVVAGVSELRINYGPDYRLYFQQRGTELIILLAGDDNNTQAKDIKSA